MLELDEKIQLSPGGMRKLSRRVIELQDLEGQKLARELRERFGRRSAPSGTTWKAWNEQCRT